MQMNRITVFIFFLLIVFKILGCQQKNINPTQLSISIEEIKIPITEEYLNSYQTFDIYEEAGDNLFIGYNNKRHSLNYFNLDSKKTLRTVNLENNGPNGLGQLSSIYFHTKDSIFVFERGMIHLIDSEGLKIDSYNLYTLSNVGDYGEPGVNFYFRLNYNTTTKNILLYLFGNHSKTLAFSPKVATLNILSREVDVIPIKHTSFYEANKGQVGFLSNIGFHGYFDDKILFNFQYESSLFLYDEKSNEIVSFTGTDSKPSFIIPLPLLDDPNDFDMHALLNVHYLSPIPDNWRKMVYRFNWESPKNLANAEFTDKRQSLTVYDEKLEFIKTFQLPDYTYQINNWFVNKKGLYVNKAHPMFIMAEEDYLLFDLFVIDKTF